MSELIAADINKNMLSGMDILPTISGDEYVEVIKRNFDGSYKNYRVLTSKLRTVSNAYDFAVDNGFVGTLPEWLECTRALYARDESTYGKVLIADDHGVAQWSDIDASIIDGLQEELDLVLVQARAAATQAATSASSAQQSAIAATSAVATTTAAKTAAINAAAAAGSSANQAQMAASATLADKVAVLAARDEVAVTATTVETINAEINESKVTVANSAAAALLSEQRATTSATAASAAATQANSSRDLAATSATTAQTAATQAGTAKTAAETAATTAATSATQATASKDAAALSATNAATSATAAAGSATAAATAKTAAEAVVSTVTAAKTAAEAAATAAATSRDTAAGHAGNASTAATQAAASQTAAAGSATSASTAASAANAAKDATVTAAQTAQTAAAEATAAKDAVEGFATGAFEARDAAEGFAVDALTSVGETQTLMLQADAAKNDAEDAATNSGMSAAESTSARDSSEGFAVNALGAKATTQGYMLDAQQAAIEAQQAAAAAAVGVDGLRDTLANVSISKHFVASGDDDTGTPYAKYKVERTHTGATSPHAFRDETVFTPPNSGQAACSYDAALSSTGSQPIDHTIGFQSRNLHNGTGQLTNFYGCGSFNISNGPVTSHHGMYVGDKAYGTIGGAYGLYNRPGIFGTAVNAYGMVHYLAVNEGATVTNSIGVRVEAANGTGTLTNEFGIYIKPFTLGVNKYPIYIEPTTGRNYIAAKTQIDQTLEVGGNARLTIGGLTGADYPAITYNHDPRLNQYIAATEASGFKWGATDFSFRHAPVGTIGATPTFTTLLNIHTANDAAKGSLTPGTTNTQSLGGASLVWKDVWAGTGVISTSDARLKTAVVSLTTPEIDAAKQLAKELGKYKFLDAIASKGDTARYHVGLTVQRAIEIFESHGLDPFSLGIICYDQWDDVFVDHPEQTIDHPATYSDSAILDERGDPYAIMDKPAWTEVVVEAWTEKTQEAGDRYSFRMDELLAFIAIGFEARLSEIETSLGLS